MVYFLYIPFHLLLSIGKYSKNSKDVEKLLDLDIELALMYSVLIQNGGVLQDAPPPLWIFIINFQLSLIINFSVIFL